MLPGIPSSLPEVLVMVNPEARDISIPEDQLGLLIQDVHELCIVGEIESPTIVITIGGTPQSLTLPELQNGTNTSSGQAIPRSALVPEDTTRRVHVPRQLTKNYEHLVRLLRGMRNWRWNDQNGVIGHVLSEEPIPPLTDFTEGELVELMEWLTQLLARTSMSMRMRSNGSTADVRGSGA